MTDRNISSRIQAAFGVDSRASSIVQDHSWALLPSSSRPDRSAQGRDAFLVLDRNNNGVIDNGIELFGDASPQPEPVRHEQSNGFRALMVFDDQSQGGNADGRITSADQIYASLRLWVDSNHDGVSQPNELFSLSSAGITELSLDYQISKRMDENGNLLRFRSFALVNDGRPGRGSDKRRMAVDVYFQYER